MRFRRNYHRKVKVVHMADQDQEITQTLRYRGVVDTSELQLQTQATTQAIMGQQQGMLSGYLSGLKTGLAAPVQEAFGFPRAEVSGGARMTLSQDMNAGWANLRTAAREYTQEGFYRQALLGTAPEYSSAGLMNRLFVQQQTAALPALAGNQRDAGQMEAMADQVMSPFSGMLGFQRRFQQTLMSAQQAGLGQYLYSPHQMLQADLQLGALTAGLNRVYRVSPQEAGQLYTGLLASGTPGAQVQGVFEQAVRSQAMGVPLQQTMQTVGQVNNVNAFRATVGLGPVEQQPGQIASLGTFGPLLGQQFGNMGVSYTPQELSRFAASIQSQVMINGYSNDNVRSAAKNSLQMMFGARARNIDVDELMMASRQSQSRLAEEESKSIRIANNVDMFNHFMDPKFILRDAMGWGGQALPTNAFNQLQRFLGYSGPNELSTPSGAGPAITRGSVGAFSRYGSSIGQLAKLSQLEGFSSQLKNGGGLFGIGGTDPNAVLQQYISAGGNAEESDQRTKGITTDMQMVARGMGKTFKGRILATMSMAEITDIGGKEFQDRLARYESGSSTSTLQREISGLDRKQPATSLYRQVFSEAGIGWAGGTSSNGKMQWISANQNLLLGVNDLARGNISREQLVDRVNSASGLTDDQRKQWLQRVDQLGSALEANPMKSGVFSASASADNVAAAHLIGASMKAASISGATMMARDPTSMHNMVGEFDMYVTSKLKDDPKNSIFAHAKTVLDEVRSHAEKGQLTARDYEQLGTLGAGGSHADSVLRRGMASAMANQTMANTPGNAPAFNMSLASASIQASKALSAFGMLIQAGGGHMPGQDKRS